MRKLILGIIVMFGIIVLSGCGSRYNIAGNGMYYQANSSNCPRSKTVGNKLYCAHKKGQFLYTKDPVHPNVIREHRYQQEQTTQAINNLNAQIAYQNRTNAIKYQTHNVNVYRY